MKRLKVGSKHGSEIQQRTLTGWARKRMNQFNCAGVCMGAQGGRNVQELLLERDVLAALRPGNRSAFWQRKASTPLSSAAAALDDGGVLRIRCRNLSLEACIAVEFRHHANVLASEQDAVCLESTFLSF